MPKNVFGKPVVSNKIVVPDGVSRVLLHACCAPCSSAIVEWLLANGVRPTIFYYNPNIWPREEYNIRKDESKRHAESFGIQWIDGDYDHTSWRRCVEGLEGEPERGHRCEQCFLVRLTATARKAQELGIPYFATTLASSRWKSLEQINRAGLTAQETVNADTQDVHFWAQNWRKGGLQERRNQLFKEYGFYNQQYCGCEFSARNEANTKPLLRAQMREAKRQHQDQLAKLSAEVVERLYSSLSTLHYPLSWPTGLCPTSLTSVPCSTLWWHRVGWCSCPRSLATIRWSYAATPRLPTFRKEPSISWSPLANPLPTTLR